MAEDVRTPVPHLFGPPGCGKSTFVEQAAQLLGVQLHSINVSRISPLELEGVQMPTDGKLELLLATYWSKLRDGDILFLDEFLRGFPEVYNGLLDILTSRTVAGHKLPKVFIIAASNSTIAYDAALTDRLLHLPVPDPRHSKKEYKRIVDTLMSALQLHPGVEDSFEMSALLTQQVFPMYKMLDQGSGINAASVISGVSPRNLIGQAKLRYVQTTELASLINASNQVAMQKGHPQYIRLYFYKGQLCAYDPMYVKRMAQIFGSLTPEQAQLAEINLQLIKAQELLKGENP